MLIGQYSLQAQNRTTGEIRGTVLDASGGIVAGTEVSAVEQATQFRKVTKSDQTGTYLLPYLPPGHYQVKFDHPGFQEENRAGVTVNASDVIQINVNLQIGNVSQSVTVSGTAANLQLESSTRDSQFTSEAIVGLPNVGRDNQVLLRLLPGASFGDQRAMGGDPNGDRVSVSGQRTYTTNFTLDGGAGTFPQSYNADDVKPPLDSTQEVNISTSNFSAEYGNGGAVFSVITKSGTNQFHGSLFAFDQNDAFGARNFFAENKNPLRWNQFGGNVGGPILKDKMFLFFTYQGLRSSSPSVSINTVPTPAMRQGDFSAAGIPTIYDPLSTTTVNGVTVRTGFPGNRIPTQRLDSVALAASQYWPLPNRPGVSNNFYYASGSTSNQDLFSGRWDYNISPNNRLSASVLEASIVGVGLGTYPGPACDCGTELKSEWQTSVNDEWTITPSLLNELRLSFLREAVPYSPTPAANGIPSQIGLKNVPNATFPNFSITGYVSTGLFSNNGFDLRQNSYVPADTFTWVHGRHIVKFGAELQKQQVNNIQPWFTSGNFDFTGAFTRNPATNDGGLGLADYYLGLPVSYALNPAPDIGERFWTVQTFVQDDYKIKPNLTLNLGLRYQIRSGWSEAHNQLSNFDPGLVNAATGTPGAVWYAGQQGSNALSNGKADLFAPRVGLAWSPLSKTVFRASYGIFYVPLSADTYSNENPAGFSINESVISTDQITPIFSLSQGPPPYALPNAANRTNSALNGQAISYLPRNFKEPYTQQWYFGIQRELGSSTVLEAAYLGTKGTHLVFPRDINQVPENELGPGNAQLLRPYPQFQAISADLADGSSIYHALQVSLKKTVSNGLTFTANYTLSKNIDNSSYDHTSGIGNIWQIAADPSASRALSQLDIPQRVSGGFVYDLPVGKGRLLLNHGGVISAILGGWQTSGIFSAESGIPFTVTVSGTNLSNSLAGTWLPNRLANGSLPAGDRSLNDWFDLSAFQAPSPYTFGNSGRDILRGPGFWNFDFALAKNFPLAFISELSQLQFRADASNVFNHPNFNLPNANLGANGAGTITGATSPRNIQLGLKFIF